MAAPPVEIGEVVAGKYAIEGVLGEGGMGIVMAARHLELDQRVAIKFLLAEAALQGNAAERFRREARSAAKIRSDHVCRVLDVGTLPSGVLYLVMELLEGWDLALELEKRGRLPVAEALEHILQACEGLAEAHAAGVIHRDLKPANLFLAVRTDGSRRVKILDFGVSKSLADSGEGNHALTQTSSLVGSPLYMSPEQLSSSKDVDPRADVWALGAVLYELLAGRPPFDGENIAQLVHRVMYEEPVSLAALDPSLPLGLDEAVLRALRKPREERYASIAELALALAPFAPRHALLSVSRVSRLLSSPDRRASAAGLSASAAPASPERASAPSTPMTWSPAARTTRARVGVGLLVLIGCVVVALLLMWRARSAQLAEPSRETEPPPHVVMPVQPPPSRQAAAQPPATDALTGSVERAATTAPLDQPGSLAPEPAEAPVAAPEPAQPAGAPTEASVQERAREGHRERAARKSADKPAAPNPAAQPGTPSAQPGVSDFGGRR